MRNVLIGFGSPSDHQKYFTPDFERLDGTQYLMSCNSAHRLPERVKKHATSMRFDATIAGAGLKNGLSDAFYLHCPEAIHVALPVYDPMTGGLSSMFSSCEMPPGCPVGMSKLNDMPAAISFVNYAMERPYSAVRIHDDGSNERAVADARKTFEGLGIPVIEDSSASAIDVLIYSDAGLLEEFDHPVIASFAKPVVGADLTMLDRFMHTVRNDSRVVHTTIGNGGNLALYAAKIIGRNNPDVRAAMEDKFVASLDKYTPFRELIVV